MVHEQKKCSSPAVTSKERKSDLPSNTDNHYRYRCDKSQAKTVRLGVSSSRWDSGRFSIRFSVCLSEFPAGRVQLLRQAIHPSICRGFPRAIPGSCTIAADSAAPLAVRNRETGGNRHSMQPSQKKIFHPKRQVRRWGQSG